MQDGQDDEVEGTQGNKEGGRSQDPPRTGKACGSKARD
jgi:hypothetical protein